MVLSMVLSVGKDYHIKYRNMIPSCTFQLALRDKWSNGERAAFKGCSFHALQKLRISLKYPEYDVRGFYELHSSLV